MPGLIGTPDRSIGCFALLATKLIAISATGTPTWSNDSLHADNLDIPFSYTNRYGYMQ